MAIDFQAFSFLLTSFVVFGQDLQDLQDENKRLRRLINPVDPVNPVQKNINPVKIKTSGSAAQNPVHPVNPVQKKYKSCPKKQKKPVQKTKALYKTLNFNTQQFQFFIRTV